MKRKEVLKIRYKMYRSLGYSSYDANKLKHTAKDISKKELVANTFKSSGKVKKSYINRKIKELKRYDGRIYDEWVYRVDRVENKSDMTDWGNLLQKNTTTKNDIIKLSKKLQKKLKITHKASIFFMYYMFDGGRRELNGGVKDYETTLKEMEVNENWEKYTNKRKYH